MKIFTVKEFAALPPEKAKLVIDWVNRYNLDNVYMIIGDENSVVCYGMVTFRVVEEKNTITPGIVDNDGVLCKVAEFDFCDFPWEIKYGD